MPKYEYELLCRCMVTVGAFLNRLLADTGKVSAPGLAIFADSVDAVSQAEQLAFLHDGDTVPPEAVKAAFWVWDEWLRIADGWDLPGPDSGSQEELDLFTACDLFLEYGVTGD